MTAYVWVTLGHGHVVDHANSLAQGLGQIFLQIFGIAL